MMERLEDFSLLPDSMEKDELNDYFLFFLKVASSHMYDKSTLFSSLHELADRQWHCYENLNEHTKEKIEVWINHNLVLDDLKIVRSLIYILAHIGLQNTYEGLKKIKLSFLPKSCSDYLLKSFTELGDNVSDPYDELKKEINDKNKKNEMIQPKVKDQ